MDRQVRKKQFDDHDTLVLDQGIMIAGQGIMDRQVRQIQGIMDRLMVK